MTSNLSFEQIFELEPLSLETMEELISSGRIIPSLSGGSPWNKGLVGMQESPYKGVEDRYTEEQRKIISENTKEAMKYTDRSCYLTRDSCNDRRWMNKDGKHKRVKSDEIFDFKQKGWNEGRILRRNEKGRYI